MLRNIDFINFYVLEKGQLLKHFGEEDLPVNAFITNDEK